MKDYIKKIQNYTYNNYKNNVTIKSHINFQKYKKKIDKLKFGVILDIEQIKQLICICHRKVGILL